MIKLSINKQIDMYKKRIQMNIIFYIKKIMQLITK